MHRPVAGMPPPRSGVGTAVEEVGDQPRRVVDQVLQLPPVVFERFDHAAQIGDVAIEPDRLAVDHDVASDVLDQFVESVLVATLQISLVKRCGPVDDVLLVSARTVSARVG